MIIYLHGFSSGAQSNKAGVIKDYFSKYSVFVPDYVSHQPGNAINYLERYIEQKFINSEEQYVMLMGSSLGGFYVQYLASQYDFVSAAVLINPCLQPLVTLASQTGEQINSVTGKPFTFTEDDLKAMANYDVPASGLFNPTLVLLDEGDEFIDYRYALERYRDKGKVIVYPGGDHWFRHLDEAMPEIEQFYTLHVKRKPIQRAE